MLEQNVAAVVQQEKTLVQIVKTDSILVVHVEVQEENLVIHAALQEKLIAVVVMHKALLQIS